MVTKLPRIAILGTGNMGGAILQGLTGPGVSSEGIRVTTRSESSASKLRATGVEAESLEAAHTANTAAVVDADIIVLARVDMGGDPSVAPEHTYHPPLVTLVGFTYAPEVVTDRRLVNLRKPTYVLPNEDLLTDLGILDQCDDR
jgi:prephenate dehydrogenase